MSVAVVLAAVAASMREMSSGGPVAVPGGAVLEGKLPLVSRGESS